MYSCYGPISADQSSETLQSGIDNQLKLSKDSTEQQPLINGEDMSPESPSLSQSHTSDEPAYDTGVSSSSSVNGDKVEPDIENNVENKSVDELEPKKADIKKAKVINNYHYILVISNLFLYIKYDIRVKRNQFKISVTNIVVYKK